MELRLNWVVALALSILLQTSDSFAIEIAPKFKKSKIQISFNNQKKTIFVELAETVEQHAYGLMNRKSLPQDEGMIFVFNDEQPREFWMKNTLIDLDIAYVDRNKKIVDIQTMKAVTSLLQKNLPTYPSKRPAHYAIEMNAGWFKKNNIDVGAEIILQAGLTSKLKK